VIGFCEHSNESLGSIKWGGGGGFLDYLVASQEELCSMELI